MCSADLNDLLQSGPSARPPQVLGSTSRRSLKDKDFVSNVSSDCKFRRIAGIQNKAGFTDAHLYHF